MGFHEMEHHMSLASVLFLYLQGCPLVFGQADSSIESPFCSHKCIQNLQKLPIGVT